MKITLPSGRDIEIHIPTIEELEFYINNTYIFDIKKYKREQLRKKIERVKNIN